MSVRLLGLAVVLAIASTAHIRVGTVTVHVAALALVLEATCCAALVLYGLRQARPLRLAVGWPS